MQLLRSPALAGTKGLVLRRGPCPRNKVLVSEPRSHVKYTDVPGQDTLL